jgi:serine/threonine protein phosphatase PrpC
MAGAAQNSAWRVIGRSVRGASHARTGMPNQDAIGWLQKGGPKDSLIVAASDGHGSAKCFRSHKGSSLAIDTALALAQEFLKGQSEIDNLSAIKRAAEDRLPQEMARRWKGAVEEDLKNNPFSTDEMDALGKTGGGAAPEAVLANPLIAYGATILTVIIAASYILYLQLGDGDILVVSTDGEVERPLQKDERLFANETTSLSSANAWTDFRFAFQAIVGPAPALILVSTDGYANSFVDEENFLKVGKDMLEIIRADGLDLVDENLEAWLNEASHSGSGDDVTLAVICSKERMEKIARPRLCEKP